MRPECFSNTTKDDRLIEYVIARLPRRTQSLDGDPEIPVRKLPIAAAADVAADRGGPVAFPVGTRRAWPVEPAFASDDDRLMDL